jgi:hypothetical protein
MKLKLVLFSLTLLTLFSCSTVTPHERDELNCVHRCEMVDLRYYDMVGNKCVCAEPRLPLYPDIP